MIKKDGKGEGDVLADLALYGEIVAGQCQTQRKENQDVKQLAETATLKIHEASKIKELCKTKGDLLNM